MSVSPFTLSCGGRSVAQSVYKACAFLKLLWNIYTHGGGQGGLNNNNNDKNLSFIQLQSQNCDG